MLLLEENHQGRPGRTAGSKMTQKAKCLIVFSGITMVLAYLLDRFFFSPSRFLSLSLSLSPPSMTLFLVL